MQMVVATGTFSYEKSLSGIETLDWETRLGNRDLSVMKNPFQGLKPIITNYVRRKWELSVMKNPFQGLKQVTGPDTTAAPRLVPFSYEKSLSGIETCNFLHSRLSSFLSVMKNPFQGLKRYSWQFRASRCSSSSFQL
jgi:hypothetical protein